MECERLHAANLQAQAPETVYRSLRYATARQSQFGYRPFLLRLGPQLTLSLKALSPHRMTSFSVLLAIGLLSSPPTLKAGGILTVLQIPHAHSRIFIGDNPPSPNPPPQLIPSIVLTTLLPPSLLLFVRSCSTYSPISSMAQ